MKHDQSGGNFVGLIHLVRENRAQRNVGRANPRVSMRNARPHLARSRDLPGDRAPISPQTAVTQGSRVKHQQPTASGMVLPSRSRPSVKDSRQSLCWARCAELRALPPQAVRVSGVLCLQHHETFPGRHIEGTSRARPPQDAVVSLIAHGHGTRQHAGCGELVNPAKSVRPSLPSIDVRSKPAVSQGSLLIGRVGVATFRGHMRNMRMHNRDTGIWKHEQRHESL